MKFKGSKELRESVFTHRGEELLIHLLRWSGRCAWAHLWVPPPNFFGSKCSSFQKEEIKVFNLPLLVWDECPFYLNMPFVSFSEVFPEENLVWTPGISSIIVLLLRASPGSFVHELKGQSINKQPCLHQM